jgi:hypothetical protein
MVDLRSESVLLANPRRTAAVGRVGAENLAFWKALTPGISSPGGLLPKLWSASPLASSSAVI